MVVWLFAGGGEAEIEGLVPFFRDNFPHCRFERLTPARIKKGPKPGKKTYGPGLTGKGFADQIKTILAVALLSGSCDLILILDCRDADKQRRIFSAAIDSVNNASGISRFIGFAAPELEAWIIADWENTFAGHVDFRSFHEGLRYRLSHNYNVPFDNPESFSEYDEKKDSCKEKLSQAIIDAVFEESLRLNKRLERYSKQNHTPQLLRCADPGKVADKCPFFKEVYNCLKKISDYNALRGGRSFLALKLTP
ncbi:hypothetical protein QUF72_01115 [Desulfobacterales bacterium HSG2]|nr:hypothetical protein [Desulfobacterales bacterium HSG2]